MRDLAGSKLAPGFLVRDPFDTRSYLETAEVPVLLLHGLMDSLNPFEHAERNAAAARNGRLVEFDAGHGIAPTDQYWTLVTTHLAQM